MSGRFFLDTNIFLYSIDFGDVRKRTVALGLIREADFAAAGAISYQVVHEFLHVVLTRSPRTFPLEKGEPVCGDSFSPNAQRALVH